MTTEISASATKDLADLISAIAALIGAIAWPIIAVLVFLIFQKQIYGSVTKISEKLDGATSIKTPFFEIGFVQAELGLAGAKASPSSGEVTQDQIQSSAKIEARSRSLTPRLLIEEMNSLCIEYERTREAMPNGGHRTQIMSQIIAKMRVLGPSVADCVEEFKCSDSPGRRLAAIAIMQMVPGKADIAWLLKRFAFEKPFIFYHSAIALKNLSRSSSISISSQAKNAAEKALETLSEFEGPKDENTLSILESIVNYR